MTIKVFIKSYQSEDITLPESLNFCLIHKYLNDKYGLKGWLGYDVLK